MLLTINSSLLHCARRHHGLQGYQPSFCQAVQLAKAPNVQRHLDDSGTFVFDRTDPAGIGFRVWMDDAESLGPKYKAVADADWGGVAMWCEKRLFEPASFNKIGSLSQFHLTNIGNVATNKRRFRRVANGMFPNGLNLKQPGVFDCYCPDELRAMWASIDLNFVQVRKLLSFSPFYIVGLATKDDPFYQDRLGTNVGRKNSTKIAVFLVAKARAKPADQG